VVADLLLSGSCLGLGFSIFDIGLVAGGWLPSSYQVLDFSFLLSFRVFVDYL
jgi:hypothetical protein